MPNSLHSSAIGSPASRRATNCSLSSMTEHSFQGITPSSLEEESVTHVSGTKCHLCLRPLTGSPMCQAAQVFPISGYENSPKLYPRFRQSLFASLANCFRASPLMIVESPEVLFRMKYPLP